MTAVELNKNTQQLRVTAELKKMWQREGISHLKYEFFCQKEHGHQLSAVYAVPISYVYSIRQTISGKN
jgi:hypothetical protein